MKPGVYRAISGLRWTLGLVVFSDGRAQRAKWRALVGDMEKWKVAAALLFLAPMTTLVGGYLLLLIFLVATTIHFCNGDFRVGALLVYAMTTVVSIAQSRTEVGGWYDGRTVHG